MKWSTPSRPRIRQRAWRRICNVVVDTEVTEFGNTVAAALDTIARQLGSAGVDSARLDARLLVGAATGETAAGLIARPDRQLSVREAEQLSTLTARRCAREPIAHILGVREFWSLDIEVSRHVLTPRPDSETIVEAVCTHIAPPTRPLRILDLGTGSGCLLLALLREYPAATGVGVDVSPAAIALAQRNSARLGLGARSAFVVGDWTASIAERFDIVVSNPPYIATDEVSQLAPEVARYEPHAALDGGADGLDAYRALFPNLYDILTPDGTALFEMGAGQDAAICALASACGLVIAGIQADMAGIPRVAILCQP